MIVCKALNQSFENKGEMFKALRENKDLIISKKKSAFYTGKDKLVSVKCKPFKVGVSSKSLNIDPDYFYIVMNTTNVLDSHGDLHVKGIWNKTVKERNKKNYIVDTHDMSLKSTIALKSDVEILLIDTTFKELGFNLKGETEALVYKVRKDKIIDDKAREWLKSGSDIEGSVSMQYVDISLAMNSDSPEDKDEKKEYLNYEDKIANKDNFDSIDYFFVVKQAKNAPESSLVLAGSNSYTRNLLDIEAVTNTSKIEPSIDTQKEESLIDFIKTKQFT